CILPAARGFAGAVALFINSREFVESRHCTREAASGRTKATPEQAFHPRDDHARFSFKELTMKTVEFIRMSLDMSAAMTMGLIDDMKDQPLTFPTPKGGNHPLWVMGHLAWVE